MRVGFVGIGTMGWPMAGHLVRAGHDVIVHDIDGERSARFVREHACRAARSVADLAGIEALITMLPNGQIVRELYLGEGLASHLSPGALAIDMSSSDPVGTRELGGALAARGIALIDAPVSGALPRARAATLTIMIGGDDAAAIERARPLLGALGNRLFSTGPLGSGHAMKALNNFVAAAGYAAAAEALLVGRRFGLDPATMIDVMNVSTGRNFNTEVVMKEHVIGRQFATGFTLGLLAKDVRTAAELGAAVGVNAPMTRLIDQRYALARERLGAARDNSEAILAWDGEPAREPGQP